MATAATMLPIRMSQKGSFIAVGFRSDSGPPTESLANGPSGPKCQNLITRIAAEASRAGLVDRPSPSRSRATSTHLLIPTQSESKAPAGECLLPWREKVAEGRMRGLSPISLANSIS